MKSNLRPTHLSLSVALAVGVTGFSIQSQAQSLEEVIVTAQKRVQGLGDVPLSVQVVDGEALEEQNIVDFKGLVERLPNVSIDNTPGSTSIRMRGVGTGAGTASAEQAVGMYIDGVYVSRGFQFNAPFTDVQSVEILKGPQGVLQGKNSVAGAVVINTRRPTEEFEAILRGSYEFENEGYNVEGIVSGALTDNIYGRLVAQQNLEGGWIDHTSRLAADGVTLLKGDDDQNEDEFYVLRGSLVWEATDTLSLFAKLETGERERKGWRFGTYIIEPGTIVGGPTDDQTPLLEDFLRRDPSFGSIKDGVASNGFVNVYNEDLNVFEPSDQIDIKDKVESDSFTFQIDWEVGLGTVTGISSYSEYDRDSATANTMAPLDYISGNVKAGDGGEQFDQFTQELRLVSPGGDTFDYIIGAFYMDRTIDNGQSPGTIINFSNGGLGAPNTFDFRTPQYFKEDTDAWSVFGQITWNILDTLRLNAGVRYTDETKKSDQGFEAVFLNVFPPLNQFALDTFGLVPYDTEDMPRDKVDDTSTDPSLSLQWDATDDMMLYASYTEATKAGGFNEGAAYPEITSYDPEQATSYEVGLKGTFMDGRLSTNIAIYHTEFDDLQVSTLDPNTNSFFFDNAAEATTEGFEADFRFAATDALELGGAIGYTDATYDDFPGANCSPGSSRESDCDPVTNSRNAEGDKLQAAPEWTGNLYADYRYALNNGMELGLQGTVIYSDEYYIAGQNASNLEQEDFTKLDLVASLTSADGNWKLSLIGKNVTDKTTVSFGGGSLFFDGASWSNVDAPRQIYLNAEYRFQ